MFTEEEVKQRVDEEVDEAVTNQLEVCWFNCGKDFNYSMWTDMAQELVDK